MNAVSIKYVTSYENLFLFSSPICIYIAMNHNRISEKGYNIRVNNKKRKYMYIMYIYVHK